MMDLHIISPHPRWTQIRYKWLLDRWRRDEKNALKIGCLMFCVHVVYGCLSGQPNEVNWTTSMKNEWKRNGKEEETNRKSLANGGPFQGNLAAACNADTSHPRLHPHTFSQPVSSLIAPEIKWVPSIFALISRAMNEWSYMEPTLTQLVVCSCALFNWPQRQFRPAFFAFVCWRFWKIQRRWCRCVIEETPFHSSRIPTIREYIRWMFTVARYRTMYVCLWRSVCFHSLKR